MGDSYFSKQDLGDILDCVNETIKIYQRNEVTFCNFACRSVIEYAIERKKHLAEKIEIQLNGLKIIDEV